ncbi:MAG TPA: hypothetical protein VGA63_00505 [Geopsychrobacteraceae bacterium]|jgi:DNA-binding CsgD family transcriptional regulator
MPTELPLAILFLVFLALFVLIGTSPLLPRLLALLGGLLRDSRRGPAAGTREPGAPEDVRWKDSALNDYEILVLRKLAMSGGKGLSSRALADALYFQPPTVRKHLHSLNRKGLVRAVKPYPFGERFYLSAPGREYALEHDLVPRVSRARTDA